MKARRTRTWILSTGPTSTDEETKLADGLVNSNCPAEWRLEATRDLLGGASLKSA